MKLLHVDSSILGDQSASRQLSAAIVKRLTTANPSAQVTRYDLATLPIDHLSKAEFMAFQGVEPQDETMKMNVTRNSKVLDDFLAADVIVLGVPMYNFSLPSQLKAWIDRLAVAGKTFRYTANGVQGLVSGKRVIVASTRGGFHSDGHSTFILDHQESYLKGLFSFLGITDISIFRAEGLGISAENRKTALAAAIVEAAKLAA